MRHNSILIAVVPIVLLGMIAWVIAVVISDRKTEENGVIEGSTVLRQREVVPIKPNRVREQPQSHVENDSNTSDDLILPKESEVVENVQRPTNPKREAAEEKEADVASAIERTESHTVPLPEEEETVQIAVPVQNPQPTPAGGSIESAEELQRMLGGKDIETLPEISKPVAAEKRYGPPPHPPEPLQGDRFDLVEIRSINPNIQIDLKYATSDNFCGRPLYSVERCFLRREVAEKLSRVQEELESMNLGLLVWDGYRPHSVQYMMWEVSPTPGYVGNPERGSKHNRGAAVDLTIFDPQQQGPVRMPTPYDEFSGRAHANAVIADKVAVKNRNLLQTLMKKHGFQTIRTEWWHFDAVGWNRFDIANVPIEDLARMRDQETGAVR